MKKIPTQKKEDMPIILFVNKVPQATELVPRIHKGSLGKKYRVGNIFNKGSLDEKKIKEYKKILDVVIECNTNSHIAITQALLPYKDDLQAITCRDESKIPDFAKIVPHVPYLKTPTSESLMWSVDKIHMRRRFHAYDKKITPKYKVVKDATQKTLHAIEEKVGFPLVIKPSGLAQSLLVTICYHQEELERELKKTFRKIRSLHKQYKEETGEDKILVEAFMDGGMYSIDGYINSRGKIYFCPAVEIQTGRTIGFDDFFGYKQITPTSLSKKSIEEAEHVTRRGVYALGLRSSSFHAELIKTDQGWKIIEIGPRIGGFRDVMYKLSYGFDHAENDILIRIPKKPLVHKKARGYTASMKFFAKNEGTLTNLTGVKKAQELASFYDIAVNKKVGDRAIYAKNGGKSVFNITLFNKERSKLLADIRRLEKMVKIETSRKPSSKKASPKKKK